jgi:hypothetical protein
MIAVLLLSRAFAQTTGCPEDPSAELERSRAAVWEAFRTVDEIAFDRASKSLMLAISCLDRVPASADISRLHQAVALASYVNGQTRACRRSFNTVRLLDPSWRLDPKQFPETHPILDLFHAATDPGPVEDLGKISPKQWVVDGVPRSEAPTERGFLLQVLDEEGHIVWSGYQWDWTELPDFGQAQARSVTESPHQWWVSTTVFGGTLSARQRAEDGVTAMTDQSRTAFSAGGRFGLRYTPISVVGGELVASIAGPADPVEGGGGLPAGHALVLLGGAGWVGQWQPYAQARLGFGLDRMRSWYPGSVVEISTAPSAIAGLGAGIHNERHRLQLAMDGRLAAVRNPYRFDLRLDGGTQISGPLAFEAGVDFGIGGLTVVDDATEAVLGSRSDMSFRIGAGIALWR